MRVGLGMIFPVRLETRTLSPVSVNLIAIFVGFLRHSREGTRRVSRSGETSGMRGTKFHEKLTEMKVF